MITLSLSDYAALERILSILRHSPDNPNVNIAASRLQAAMKTDIRQAGTPL